MKFDLPPVFKLRSISSIPSQTGLSEQKINQQEKLFERREFKGAGPEGPGWTLGISTGPGFNKR